MRKLDLLGQRFGMLTVIENVGSDGVKTLVKCLCDCGVEKVYIACDVKRGQYKSCGCNQFPRTTKLYRGHPLYDVWKGMKARCRDKKNISYIRYGAKGVKVCDEWANNFFAFYNWAIENGWKQGMQIDKDIKAKKLGVPAIVYSPEMCSVVTRTQNVRVSRQTKLNINKVQEIRKSSISNRLIAEKYGLHISTIQRIKSNKSWQ